MSLLEPLRHRDFALLSGGMVVSLLGDGIWLVAVPFQVYAIENDPSALALVGLCWAAGMVGCLPFAGVAADRLDRRAVMITADLLRLVVAAAVGVLALSGELELWQLYGLVVFYGIGEGLFGPAFSALVPDVVPEPALVGANALSSVVRQSSLRLAGPVIGGVAVAAASPAEAFLVNAATFAVSIGCLLAMRVRVKRTPTGANVLAQAREGLAFVRSQRWLWATLLGAAIALLAFIGPVEVLLPYLIKNELDGTAADFGLVMGAGGVGAIVASLWQGRRGMPRRPLAFMYFWWTVMSLAIAGYALAGAQWQLMMLGLVYGAGGALGNIVWSTLMQVRVPPQLRGRVSSVDWFVSVGLIPVSFALVGPVEAAFGPHATLLGAGVLSALATVGIYVLLLGQGAEVFDEAGIADVGGLHALDGDAVAGGQAGDGAEHGQPVVPVRSDRPAP